MGLPIELCCIDTTLKGSLDLSNSNFRHVHLMTKGFHCGTSVSVLVVCKTRSPNQFDRIRKKRDVHTLTIFFIDLKCLCTSVFH